MSKTAPNAHRGHKNKLPVSKRPSPAHQGYRKGGEEADFAKLPAKRVCALEDIAVSGVLKCAPRGISDANPSEGEMGLRRPEAGCILSAA